MSGYWFRLLCFSCCVTATALYTQVANAADPAVQRQIQQRINEVRTGKTLDARADAADELAYLMRTAVDPKDIDDGTLAKIISLLDTREDAVRSYVAGALGFLGPRAKSAVPKLLKILPQADREDRFCGFGPPPSGQAIRVAVERISGTVLPPPACER